MSWPASRTCGELRRGDSRVLIWSEVEFEPGDVVPAAVFPADPVIGEAEGAMETHAGRVGLGHAGEGATVAARGQPR